MAIIGAGPSGLRPVIPGQNEVEVTSWSRPVLCLRHLRTARYRAPVDSAATGSSLNQSVEVAGRDFADTRSGGVPRAFLRRKFFATAETVSSLVKLECFAPRLRLFLARRSLFPFANPRNFRTG